MRERREPVWVGRRDADTIHERLLAEHGGLPGVKDENALESALHRPLNKFAYEPDSDLFALAAAYGFALATSHGYSDGNKRTAYMVMYSFLLVNGYEIDVSQQAVVALMLDVATRRVSEEALSVWLREHTVPVSDN